MNSYAIYIVTDGASERYGDLKFANFESAFHFGLEYLPGDVDFLIEPLEQEQVQNNVISLCEYRKRKAAYGTAI